MHNNNIHYISHGGIKTGGYLHEMELGNYLAKCLGAELKVFRYTNKVKGLSSFLKLWTYAFHQSTSRMQITVQRLALPVALACLLRKSSMILVWHHYDERQKHSFFYHFNAKLLIYLLKSGWNSLRVVVVSTYWRDWLIDKGVSSDLIQLVPNLFDTDKYKSIEKPTKKDKAVCFGQYGIKQHPEIFELINRLHEQGYFCYFTSPDDKAIKQTDTYTVFHLPQEQYLHRLASSMYTVCFSAFAEGWNRLAHESILVGTTVIGNEAGGLGLLLKEAEQLIISHPLEALPLITAHTGINQPDRFINKYDIKQISYYADSLVVFGKHAIR